MPLGPFRSSDQSCQKFQPSEKKIEKLWWSTEKTTFDLLKFDPTTISPKIVRSFFPNFEIIDSQSLLELSELSDSCFINKNKKSTFTLLTTLHQIKKSSKSLWSKGSLSMWSLLMLSFVKCIQIKPIDW